MTRTFRTIPRFLAGFIGALMGITPVCQGVIHMDNGDPGAHLVAPTGVLEGSGWIWQGEWENGSGTVIQSNLFLTAKHLGGRAGNIFRYQGQDYRVTDGFLDGGSDLAIWRVQGTFSSFAPLYRGGNEMGKALVLHGRGAPRGEEVRLPNQPNGTLKGWKWALGDQTMRWATNRVTSILNVQGLPTTGADPGGLLYFTLDFSPSGREGTLGGGDSGGGLFLFDGGSWFLAGVNYSAQGRYRYSGETQDFLAALFDQRGMERETLDGYALVPNGPFPVPGGAYVSRISANLNWIDTILSILAGQVPPPVPWQAVDWTGPWTPVTGYEVDLGQSLLHLPLPDSSRFFRLEGVVPWKLGLPSHRENGLDLPFQHP